MTLDIENEVCPISKKYGGDDKHDWHSSKETPVKQEPSKTEQRDVEEKDHWFACKHCNKKTRPKSASKCTDLACEGSKKKTAETQKRDKEQDTEQDTSVAAQPAKKLKREGAGRNVQTRAGDAAGADTGTDAGTDAGTDTGAQTTTEASETQGDATDGNAGVAPNLMSAESLLRALSDDSRAVFEEMLKPVLEYHKAKIEKHERMVNFLKRALEDDESMAQA